MRAEGEQALLDRIDKDGVLRLTMDDMRKGATFEEADQFDIRWSMKPAARAKKVILEHEGKERVLKDRSP